MSSFPPPVSPPPPPPPAWSPLQARPGWSVAPTYAGFWPRFGAVVIDGFIATAAGAALAVPGLVMLFAGYDDPTEQLNGLGVVGLIVLLLSPFAALAVGLWIAWKDGATGQGPGKKALGIKVWRSDGAGPIGGGAGIGRRLFAWFISGQIVYLGYLWMLWDKPLHQTWHDKVVDSVVVKV